MSSVREAVIASGFTIYDPIAVGDPEWFSSEQLEAILNAELVGLSLAALPLRTRSKFSKIEVCKALGYPVPDSFRKTKPRFEGQDFDIYVQKSNNLQVWNEQLSATRRYVLIRLSEHDIVTVVRVINGAELAKLDTTGKLTKKFQARLSLGSSSAELVSPSDTRNLQPLLGVTDLAHIAPTAAPSQGSILPINEAFDRLKTVIGKSFADLGSVQERNRGAALHGMVCHALGYHSYGDTGQFPDIRHQLIEVKLQTSTTIDLGLVLPSSTDSLDIPTIVGQSVKHCDVRYAVFYGNTDGKTVTITHLILSTGEAFFTRFTQFQGNVSNSKLQIRLPSDLFDR